MGITERRLRQKDEVRSSILDTAWQIVKEEGWQSLSIRKIADAIEYSVPVIYDHFANKEAILQEFGKKGYCQLWQKMDEAKRTSADAGEQIKAMAEAYWNFALRNKEYYQLMFGLGIACCDTQKCITENEPFEDLVMEPINTLLEQNKNKSINSCLKYHTFWSVLHGLVSIKITTTSADVNEELNKLVLEDAIDGFIKNLKG